MGAPPDRWLGTKTIGWSPFDVKADHLFDFMSNMFWEWQVKSVEFKEVKIWAFAKIKSYFSISYVKIILFKVLKKAYLIDFIRLMFTKAQKISLLFSMV